MTLAELGRATSLDPTTINRYEKGRQEPTAENLQKLASALRFPAAFFELPEIDQIPVEGVSFRALSKTPASRRDAALAAGELAVEIAQWIGRHFTLPTPDLPSLVNRDDVGLLRCEEIAYVVRARWDLGDKPIGNVVHLLESRGVRVFSLAKDVREVDAFSMFKRGTPYVILDTRKTAERQRFDGAHELGHLVMHQSSEKPQGREAERQADRFAAAFLMPRDDVLSCNLRNASLERLLRARRRWKVSAMALAHRLRELDLLTEWGYRSLCIELSQRGYRRTEPDSDLTPESSQVLEKVLKYLRSEKSGVRRIVADLGISHEVFNACVFGLARTVVDGGNEKGSPDRPERPVLRLVASEG